MEPPTTATTVPLGGRGASAALVRRDPRFKPLKDRFGPAKVEVDRDHFAALVAAICNQQLSVAAGRTVYGRIERLCGGTVTARRILNKESEALRGCGLSRPKVAYVRDLAERVRDGSLPLDRLESMSDEEVTEALTAVKGIGVWTAQMLLIFTLHRPDVLPTADLGIVDAARIVFGLDARPDHDEMVALAEPWRPYRSVACWYLWHERDRRVRDPPLH